MSMLARPPAEFPLLPLEVIYVVIAVDRRATGEESWLFNAVVAALAGSPEGTEAVETSRS